MQSKIYRSQMFCGPLKQSLADQQKECYWLFKFNIISILAGKDDIENLLKSQP